MSIKREGYSICVDGISLERGGKKIIDNVSLKVATPGITAVIGPNGAGKSSLLSVMAGLVVPSSGVRKFTDSSGNEAAITSIGFMLQRPVLLRRSLRSNLRFAMNAAGIPLADQEERINRVILQMGLSDKENISALRLSQGERQRLALARVMAMDARLMMFDEATNTLDPATVMMIEETAKTLAAQGKPVIWVSHDLAQVRRIADRIVMMVSGRIEADAPARSFFTSPPTPKADAFLRGALITD